jgi:hypothetical protein
MINIRSMKMRQTIIACSLLLVAIAFGSAVPYVGSKTPAEPHQLQADSLRPPGVVIAESLDPKNIFVASPSLVILNDGSYLCSVEWTGPMIGDKRNTSIYRSTDKGKSWKKISEVKPMRWATLFVHNKSVYLFGVKDAYSAIHITKSDDKGQTWTQATDKNNGVLFNDGRYHTGPVPVIVHNKRIWRAFEDQKINNDRNSFEALVVSAPIDADLLKASSWVMSNKLGFKKSWLNALTPGVSEGNVVVTPDGEVVDILRVETHPGKEDKFALEGGAAGIPRFEVATMMKTSADGKHMSFNQNTDFIHFPGGESKFTIRYDPKTKRYWTLANKITKMHQRLNFDYSPHRQRNVMSLLSSPDLKVWTEHSRILKWKEGEIMEKKSPVAFQYLDWQFEGKDIVAVSRTAWYGNRAHDANFVTFHRVENFRNLASMEIK